MGRYILKRLLLILPTLFLILLANFVIVQAAPGGPVEQQLALIEQGAKDSAINGGVGAGSSGSNSTYQGTRGLSEDMVAAINAQYGFDKSAPERFWLMLKSYAQLDFGESFFKGQTVTDLIIEKLPVSISLGLWSTLLLSLIHI